MKDGFISVAVATPEVEVANCIKNAAATVQLVEEAAARGVKLLVLPELGLTAYTCGDLFLQPTLLRGAETALAAVLDATLRNINVMQESSVGPALSMNFDMRKDVRGVFMAKKETLLSLANVHAVNERGQSSLDIDRINHHIVNVEKINFRLPERRE